MIKLTELYTNVLVESIETDLSNAFSSLGNDLKTVVKNEEVPQQEGIDTIVGLWLSGPFVIKYFGKFVRKIESTINKYRKSGNDGNFIGDKIIAFAEKYHHIVLVPFEWLALGILKGVGKGGDKKLQHKIAQYLFMVVIGVLLSHGGYNIVKKVASAKFDWSLAFKSMKSSVKSAELWVGIQEVLAESAEVVIEIIEEAGEVGTMSTSEQ